MTRGSGCNNCPASKGCAANYRGSNCSARRAKAGADWDPLTNAELLAQQATDAAKMAAYLCWQGWQAKDTKECEEWLKQPFEPGGELDTFFNK